MAVAADKIPNFVVRGNCPNVDERALWSRQSSQLSNYAGAWFEMARTENPFQQVQQCVRNEYQFDGSKFVARTSGRDASGQLAVHQGQVLPMPAGDPHLVVDYQGSWTAPYVVLNTDYSSFSCVYSCLGHTFAGDASWYSDFGFIFQRSPYQDQNAINTCLEEFRRIGVPSSRFQYTVQGEPQCDYATQVRL